MVTLLQSTRVHIPLLDQCCLFNRSASCLWLLSFLLNITGQIPSAHPPPLPTPTSCLSFPANSSHKELLLTIFKCLNCERLFRKPKPSSARWRRTALLAARWECRVEKPGAVLLHSLRLPGAGSSSRAFSALGSWMQLVQMQLTSLPAGSVG